MRYNTDKTELLEVGEAPLLLEPVQVEVTLKNAKKGKVYVLDHSGNRTGINVPINNGKTVLDGSKYKAVYYEITRE
jgi:hypothetical protein